MNTYKSILVLSSLLILTVNSSVFADDILQVYSDAASNSLRYKSASVDYQIATEKKNEIMAEYDPELAMRITPSYLFSSSGSTNTRSNRSSANSSDDFEIDYSLGLNKPIYRKNINARISQADSIIKQEEALLDSEKQALIARVATSYFGYLNAQNKLKYNLSEQRTIRKNANQLNNLYRAKRATITDLQETKSRLDQSLAATTLAKNSLDGARKDLSVITGQAYYSLATLNTNRQFVRLEPATIDSWIKLANENSHEIVVANRELDIKKKAILIERTGASSTVDLFARYEGTTNLGSGSSDSYSDTDGKVGFEVNIPLYTGDKVLSKVRSANLHYKKAHYDLGFKQREVIQQVKFAYQTVMSDLENIQALKRAVNSSEKTLRIIREGRVAGTRTMSDVLSSLRESYAVKRDYTQARLQYLVDIIKLKQAAGILSVDDLGFMNSLLINPTHVVPNLATAKTIQEYHQTRKHNPVRDVIVTSGSLEDAWRIN